MRLPLHFVEGVRGEAVPHVDDVGDVEGVDMVAVHVARGRVVAARGMGGRHGERQRPPSGFAICFEAGYYNPFLPETGKRTSSDV